MLDHALAKAPLEAPLAAFEQPLPLFENTVGAALDPQTRGLEAPRDIPCHTFTTPLEPALQPILLALDTPHPPFDAVANGLGIRRRGHGCRRQHQHCDDSPQSSHVLSFAKRAHLLTEYGAEGLTVTGK